METLLEVLLATARSSCWELAVLKLAATTATGLVPVGKSARGKTSWLEGAPAAGGRKMGPSTPRAMGKRSPTKNVAGCPSSAHNSTRRPLRNRVRVFEKNETATGRED